MDHVIFGRVEVKSRLIMVDDHNVTWELETLRGYGDEPPTVNVRRGSEICRKSEGGWEQLCRIAGRGWIKCVQDCVNNL